MYICNNLLGHLLSFLSSLNFKKICFNHNKHLYVGEEFFNSAKILHTKHNTQDVGGAAFEQ